MSPVDRAGSLTETNFTLGSYEKFQPGFRDEKRPKTSCGAKFEKQANTVEHKIITPIIDLATLIAVSLQLNGMLIVSYKRSPFVSVPELPSAGTGESFLYVKVLWAADVLARSRKSTRMFSDLYLSDFSFLFTFSRGPSYLVSICFRFDIFISFRFIYKRFYLFCFSRTRSLKVRSSYKVYKKSVI